MPKQETIGLRDKKQVLGPLRCMFASKLLRAIFPAQLSVYSERMGGCQSIDSTLRLHCPHNPCVASASWLWVGP